MRDYSFSGYQATNPKQPLPGPRVDDEFIRVQQSTGSLVDAMGDIRRSDGKLKNGIVGPDQLSPALVLGFTMRGTWVADTAYNSADGVYYDNKLTPLGCSTSRPLTRTPDVAKDLWRYLFGLADITIPDGTLTVAKLSDDVKRGVPFQYDTLAEADAATIPPVVQYVRTSGYTAVGDGGGALYKRVATPDAPKLWQFQSADGAWWELTEKNPNDTMFGVFPDGADHRTRIAAAIDYLGTGAALVFDPGTFTFPDKVGNISAKSNITIRGAGKGATIFKSTVSPGAPAFGDAVFFFFSASHRVRLEGITFDMQGTLTTNTNTCALAFVLCDHVHFVECEIRNGRRLGLLFNGCHFYRVEGCYLQKSGGPEGTYQNEAVMATVASSVGGMIIDNILEGWGTLLSGADIHIERNIIFGFGYGAGFTINADNFTLRPVIIGNTLRDSSGLDVNETRAAGVECWAPFSLIQDNICSNNGGSGITFAGTGSIVTGNVYINNGNYNHAPEGSGTADYRGAGIALTWQIGVTPAKNCIIANNVCYDTGRGYQKNGYMELVNANALFANNVIRDNWFSNNTGADVALSPDILPNTNTRAHNLKDLPPQPL